MCVLKTVLGSNGKALIVFLVLHYCRLVPMSITYKNLKKHLELAIRQLKEIQQDKKFDVEELCALEAQVTDLITEPIDATEEE